MKKQTSIILLLSLLLSLCLPILGCSPFTFTGKNKALYSTYVCVVPGAGNPNSTVSNGLEVLDTDSYGRTLFRYSQQLEFYSWTKTYAYVICQKYDANGAYYFKDISFVLTNDPTSVDQNRIDALKKRNGWEQPLDLTVDGMQYTAAFTAFRFSDWDHDNGHYYDVGTGGEQKIGGKLTELDQGLFGDKDFKVHCFDIYDDGKGMYIVAVYSEKAGWEMKAPSGRESRTCIVATYPNGTIYEGSPFWIDNPFSDEFYRQLIQFRTDFENAAKNQFK